MNILHLSAQKPDSTGSGIYLRETVAALDRKGHAQAVIAGIALEDEPHFPEGVLFHPVRFETPELPFPVVGMSNVMPYRATRYANLTSPMAEQFKTAFRSTLNEVLDEFTPDLIICHHLYLVCAVMAHLVSERAATDPALSRCVVCGLSHSTDIRQMLQIPLERDFIKSGVQKLDWVLALHDEQAAEIAQVYDVDPSRIKVVGTGYDAKMFKVVPGLRKPGTSNIVFVGKICRKKGVESLLRSLGPWTRHFPNLKVTLVGGYSDEQEYDEIVDVSLTTDAPVEFAGRLSEPELIKAYNEADVFVLPSFYEGLPLVIVEALACGCKVVTTDLPGVRPWLDGNVENAPVTYVEPPKMHNVDTPAPEDLPAFETRLAQALETALCAPTPHCDLSRVSWDALADRLASLR